MINMRVREPVATAMSGGIKHKKLLEWVQDIADSCKPESIHWCDGSEEEYQLMIRLMVQGGTAVALNPKLRPGSVFVRSSPADVARVEDRTFICSAKKEEVIYGTIK